MLKDTELTRTNLKEIYHGRTRTAADEPHGIDRDHLRAQTARGGTGTAECQSSPTACRPHAAAIAEAALSLNRVFEAAQAAADQYLESVKAQYPVQGTEFSPTANNKGAYWK